MHDPWTCSRFMRFLAVLLVALEHNLTFHSDSVPCYCQSIKQAEFREARKTQEAANAWAIVANLVLVSGSLTAPGWSRAEGRYTLCCVALSRPYLDLQCCPCRCKWKSVRVVSLRTVQLGLCLVVPQVLVSAHLNAQSVQIQSTNQDMKPCPLSTLGA